jgi:hypothetical protein|tara:strand:+ start:95 stop:352 length:258 start_codon:yes stop_codon:yes gene_type:complete
MTFTKGFKMFGYIVRETEKAVAFVQEGKFAGVEVKALWVPRSKINSMVERDSYSPSIQLAGEKIRRFGIPTDLEIDPAFLEKIGV